MLRVAAYTRVSMICDKLENSLANQISYYNDLIQKNKNWKLVKIYSDNGISGTATKKRAGFNEMMKDALDGKIDLILTKSITRFARNTVDLLKSTRKLKEYNVEVKFEKENISNMDMSGELLLTILASFAQAEAQSISDNVKWGIRKRFEIGIIKDKDLYGYDRKGTEYIINEKEAKLVREIFDRLIKGESYTAIFKDLNKRNIKTKYNNEFNIDLVKFILKQEKYTGDTLCQKRFVYDTLSHKVKHNEGELPQYLVEGTHPVIIDKKTFEKAQEVIVKRLEDGQKAYEQGNWMTGFVKCPVCGRSMIKNNGHFLRCIGNIKYHTCDNRQTLDFKELEDFIKGKNVNKIKHIIFKKTRLEPFSRKGIKPGEQPDRNIKAEDFEIVWK